MNAKHTPGPWRVESINYDGDGGTLVRRNENNGRARCIANVWGIKNAKTPDAESRANSHLIAAAPELLEALEALLEREGEHPDFEDDADGCDLVVTVGDIRKARAAITKARGE